MYGVAILCDKLTSMFFLSAVTVCPVTKHLVTAKTEVGNMTDFLLSDHKTGETMDAFTIC